MSRAKQSRQEQSPASVAPAPEIGESRVGEPAQGGRSADLETSPRALRQTALQTLQETHGNSVVQQRLLRAGWLQRQDAGTETTTDAGTTTADAGAVPADLIQLRDHGPFPADALGTTIQPPTSRGGFNARYDPTSMNLDIIVNIAMTFLNGIEITGGAFSANDPALQALADAANRLRGRRRRQAEDHIREFWQWHGDENDWMSTYRSTVTQAWSSAGTGLSFRGTRPGWEDQLANVNVHVNTSNVTAPAGGGAAPAPDASNGPIHCQATIFKTGPVELLENIVPPPEILNGETSTHNTSIGGNELDIGAEVDQHDPNKPTDQTMVLGSDQAVTDTQKLTHSVYFGHDEDAIDAAQRGRLDQFITTFQPPAGGAGTSLDIVGHANTVGGTDDYNRDLSLRRANAVADYLRTAVVNGATLANAASRITTELGIGTAGADTHERWRRVDVIVAGGPAQNVAAHEFGHLIGLGDEYATPAGGMLGGTPGNIGDAAGHNQLATDQGLGGAVKENNDSMMSLGNTVSAPHYATFMFALRRLTSIDDWGINS